MPGQTQIHHQRCIMFTVNLGSQIEFQLMQDIEQCKNVEYRVTWNTGHYSLKHALFTLRNGFKRWPDQVGAFTKYKLGRGKHRKDKNKSQKG